MAGCPELSAYTALATSDTQGFRHGAATEVFRSHDKDVFSAEVLLSSTEDALAVTVEGENGAEATEHFKFKTGSGKNLGNKAIYSGAGHSSRIEIQDGAESMTPSGLLAVPAWHRLFVLV